MFFCRQNRKPGNEKLSTRPTRQNNSKIMPINGCRIPYLIQSQARSLASLETALPHRCHIHRTICHHAQRPRRAAAPGPAAPAFHCTQRRFAKTKSTVKLKDLPQGALKLEPYDEAVDDTPRYPTVVQGHRNNMQKFKNCVVLTRVGGFYEVLFTIAPLQCAGSDRRIALF